ncbi:acyl-CoA thioesterase [Halpernia frigidisoli]|uniref:Acyl-CoA hydrolase n=1 Tax=Halpernia frigidisoli TaxID=1125876 RepID=A0A1I3E2V2_9FLAO|nr:hotdog domain-containing protein [Halpernia frigidisoli]SFH93183.1 Acyl-CoA hydrolase [Halpernia frigidisoli]
MNYHTRKWVKPEDLNPNHSLFGGRLLQWIDEEAALYSIIQLENNKVVTKYISEINFISSAKQGDIIEIGIEILSFGNSSLNLKCQVRNKMTHQTIITVEKIVMVALDENGNPVANGKTQMEYTKDHLENGQ